MIDFYAGLAAFRLISFYYNKICLPGIFGNGYAKEDLPFNRPDIDYIMDSGAFQDVSKDKRLSFELALERQTQIIEYVKLPCSKLVTYDFLVDEKYIGDGKKIKDRVDNETAEYYVGETIKAAKYYDTNARKVSKNLIISAQGINPEQYYKCGCEVLKYCQKDDIFGLGGFCILGLQKRLIPSALLTFQKVIPLVKEAGLSQMHIFGVTTLDVLFILYSMCSRYNLKLSTDSTAFSRAARFGHCFDASTGRRIYMGPQIVNSPELAVMNVLNYAWVLEDIKNRYHYKGKKGWLKAIDFDYHLSYSEDIF